MKKTNILLSLAAIAVSSLAGLSACNSDDGSLVINFWHTFGKTPEGALEAKAKEFRNLVMEHDGVKVKVVLK